ncbi:MAG: hypothetical protein IPM24_16860 [Bryobacterales bacterium]|nr:hypothetical protein [Bryobacterales bacterium]
MERLAQSAGIDTRCCTDLSRKMPNADTAKLAVLGCLHLADKLRDLETTLQSLDRIGQKSGQLNVLLDQVLTNARSRIVFWRVLCVNTIRIMWRVLSLSLLASCLIAAPPLACPGGNPIGEFQLQVKPGALLDPSIRFRPLTRGNRAEAGYVLRYEPGQEQREQQGEIGTGPRTSDGSGVILLDAPRRRKPRSGRSKRCGSSVCSEVSRSEPREDAGRGEQGPSTPGATLPNTPTRPRKPRC